MNTHIAVRGIAVKNNQLFCVKLRLYRDPSGVSDFWCTPGGGLDAGESLQDGLRRELLEELGVHVDIGTLLYVHQYRYNESENIEFLFHITNPEAFDSIDLSKTTHGIEEIAEFGFIDPAHEHILPEFLTAESFDDLAAQPTKYFSYL